MSVVMSNMSQSPRTNVNNRVMQVWQYALSVHN